MAVAYASSNVAVATSDNDLVITKPTGLAEGDMMVAFCVRDADGSGFDTPSGWTELAALADGTNISMDAFAKVASSGDAAASDFTFVPASASGDGSEGILYRVTGASFSGGVSTLVVDASGEDDSTGGENSITYTGLTPAGTSALLMQGYCTNNTTVAFSGYAVVNNDPSWTELIDGVGAGFDWASAYGSYASGDATGDFSATPDTNGTYLGIMVSVSESTDVTVNLDLATLTASPKEPAVTGGSNITLDLASLTASPKDPVVTTATPKYANQDKNSTSVTNQSKT